MEIVCFLVSWMRINFSVKPMRRISCSCLETVSFFSFTMSCDNKFLHGIVVQQGISVLLNLAFDWSIFFWFNAFDATCCYALAIRECLASPNSPN